MKATLILLAIALAVPVGAVNFEMNKADGSGKIICQITAVDGNVVPAHRTWGRLTCQAMDEAGTLLDGVSFSFRALGSGYIATRKVAKKSATKNGEYPIDLFVNEVSSYDKIRCEVKITGSEDVYIWEQDVSHHWPTPANGCISAISGAFINTGYAGVMINNATDYEVAENTFTATLDRAAADIGGYASFHLALPFMMDGNIYPASDCAFTVGAVQKETAVLRFPEDGGILPSLVVCKKNVTPSGEVAMEVGGGIASAYACASTDITEDTSIFHKEDASSGIWKSAIASLPYNARETEEVVKTKAGNSDVLIANLSAAATLQAPSGLSAGAGGCSAKANVGSSIQFVAYSVKEVL